MSIKSIVGSLAAYALKMARDAGKAIEIPSLGIVIPPEPSFKNVIPGGTGWYRWNGKKWERWTDNDGEGRYLTQADLTDFAIEAMKVLAK